MRRESIVPVLALTFALVIVPARLCQAQWQVNGGPVCTAVLTQTLPMIVSDGAGGAIVTWYDGRSGNNYIIIYAQRLNAAGVPQWTADGVALCSVAGALFSDGDPGPAMVSDGAGGAIVTWSDGRSGNGDIYAQRVSAAGVPQWTADGVALCTNPSTQYPPAIASDGAGGAIVAWADFRNSSSPNFQSDIYAQRITAAGVPQWTADGVALCTNPSYQYSPTIASDGAGGAIVTWYDQRRNFPGTDIYAQRVSAAGAPQWSAGGGAAVARPRGAALPGRRGSGLPEDRLGRRGRRHRRLGGLPQQQPEHRHLRPAGKRGRGASVDPGRGGAVHHRRKPGHDRIGRRGRCHRHLAGLPQRDELRHLRPAGGRRGGAAVDRRRRSAMQRREQSGQPHDRIGRRGGRRRQLAGLPQRGERPGRHLRPAGERGWGTAMDRRRRGTVH